MDDVTQYKDTNALIGGSILSLITSGMYVSPLAIYREYLQNAADAIASSSQQHNGKVEITLDLSRLYVTVRDNGPGLTYEQAVRELVPISQSRKQHQQDRGFRGIGRLSGLAFGRSVTFLTRNDKNSPVTKITWDGERLRDGINNKLSVEASILQCTTVEKLKNYDYPSNFFEVRIEGISRYAATFILNRDVARDYIGEVCPVPFSDEFPYAIQVSELFKEKQSSLTFNVYLDGDKEPVTRLHKEGLQVSGGHRDRFADFEEIRIPALEGFDYAARGWIAHSSYLGALPKKTGVRCLRARIGNIQIGDETVFDHLYSESRFNRWCVAEIHIQDPRIVPNGRRDYFEPNAHLRNLENHLGAVCRRLERRCRQASKERNQQRRVQSSLSELDAAYEMVTVGYLNTDATKDLIDNKLAEIADLRKKIVSTNGYDENVHKLDCMEEKFRNYNDGNKITSLPSVAPSDEATYRQVFQVITEISPSPQVAKQTIEAILNHRTNC